MIQIPKTDITGSNFFIFWIYKLKNTFAAIPRITGINTMLVMFKNIVLISVFIDDLSSK